MKNLNKIIAGLFACALMLGAPSCGDDFLEEDGSHKVTDELLQTPEGVKKMVGSLYANIRWWGGYEWAYGVTLYGCDEFTSANDLTSECWNNYDSRLNPLDCTPANGAANGNCPPVSGVWNQMYFGISTANLIIANEALIPAEIKDRALGEAHFLRGYNYLRLFGQYGAVVLQTEPVESTGTDIPRNYKRASEAETMQLIIDDLEAAYKYLPEKEKWVYYAWTKYTAAHFLAKAYLFRQSERCDQWNSTYDKKKDLDRAIALCTEVINNCPLVQDYSELYADWTGIDCPIETNSSEILMAIPHNDASSTKGRYGNRTYNYFNPQFSNFSGGFVQRGQYIGGMDFQRCRPTEYTYSVFDNVNDSRMWKTFKTVYGYNNFQTDKLMQERGCPVGAEPDLGDPGIMYILNKKGTSVSQYGTVGVQTELNFDTGEVDKDGKPKKINKHTFVYPNGIGPEEWGGKWVPNVTPLYEGEKYEMDQHSGVDRAHCNNFCGINKTDDGTRTAEKGDSYRDITLARTGETYLVKAECQLRNGDDAGALATINELRARAQFKAGEDREAYKDGTQAFELYPNSTASSVLKKCKDEKGDNVNNKKAYEWSYITKNTYCISTGLTKPAGGWGATDLQISSWGNLPAEDQAVLAKLGVDAGSFEGKLHFIFNERTRELLGEWNRWEELSRTRLLHKRAKAFNIEASGIQDRHILRPIPQTFIDGLLDDNGQNLSDGDKAAWQNPGY